MAKDRHSRRPRQFAKTSGAYTWLVIYYAMSLLFLSLLAYAFGKAGWEYLHLSIYVIALLLGAITPYHAWRQRRLHQRLIQGLYLLREQDFGTRLKPIGARDVDEVVEVFNALQAVLKSQKVQLGEQGVLLAQLIETMPMGLVLGDFDGRVAQVNPAAQELMGLQNMQSIRGCELLTLAAEWNPETEGITVGKPIVVRDSTANAYRICLQEFRDRGFARQYLQLERLTEMLHDSERATYSKLIRMLSHEVQNTTGGVSSILESTAEYLGGQTDGSTYKEAIEIVAQRMVELTAFVRRIAELIKLPEPVRTEVDARGLLQRYAGVLRLSHQRVEVVEHLPDCPVRVKLDELLMGRVLENVLKNAVEALGDAGGTISVELIEQDGWELCIGNTGAGIPTEATNQLFTPFYTTKAHGQGLGLMLCREILIRHGFPFRLSTEPDGWTRFRIHLKP